MTTRHESDLRTRLREETARSHEALDMLMSGFDLARIEGLHGFLATQQLALSQIENVADAADSRRAICIIREAAETDIKALGGKSVVSRPCLNFSPTPLAIDYIIAGSRLGSIVLKKRWLAAKDPTVRSACAYFTAPDFLQLWRAFCQRAQSIDGAGAQADRIVGDAARLFDFYAACTGAITGERRPKNA